MADLLCPVVVGRAAETARCGPPWPRPRAARAGWRFLTGDAGIGKSRLAGELAAEARARGVTVLTGRAVPADAGSPYRPLTEALLQALRAGPLPADEAWRRGGRVAGDPPAIAGTGGDGPADHPPEMRGEAVLQLLRGLAGPGGLLLVLEDLHWADPDTLAVVEYLSDNLSAELVLCLATCRDERATAAAGLMARLHGRRAAARIVLGGCRPVRSPRWCAHACRAPRGRHCPGPASRRRDSVPGRGVAGRAGRAEFVRGRGPGPAGGPDDEGTAGLAYRRAVRTAV